MEYNIKYQAFTNCSIVLFRSFIDKRIFIIEDHRYLRKVDNFTIKYIC